MELMHGTLFKVDPSTAAPATVCIKTGIFSFAPARVDRWTRWDLNPGPLPCKGSALPAELRALGVEGPLIRLPPVLLRR
jgi:hypothetical protein